MSDIQTSSFPNPDAFPAADSTCPAAGPSAGVDSQLLSACIHCGLCLPACPTYLATGREMESPRGRIYLINQWQSGQQALSPRLVEHLESCLGCLGCQTACPSGVEYEKILNQARPSLASQRPAATRRLMRFVFARLLPDYPQLRLLGRALRLWQKSGGSGWFSAWPVLGKLLGPLKQWQALLPPVPPFKPLPRQSWRSGEKAGQVVLFTGCVMDIFYNQVNHACQRLLVAQRQIVRVPEQTCCGALAFHAGEVDIAQGLAKRNIELLESTPGEIVVTAAGCGAMLKGYGQLLEHDEQWKRRAAEFSSRVRDIAEFLAAHEFAQAPRPVTLKVAYQAACHLAHAQNIHQQPLELLQGLPGISLVPLKEAEHCCGSAGIFNLTHAELSGQILERKLGFLQEAGADVLVTTNPGCLMQLDAGIQAAGLPLKVKHLAELLDEIYAPDPEAE